MATAGDIVKGSLRLIGALTRGETPASEDTTEALQALNDLAHSWYAENTMVPFVTREQFTLTQGKRDYTIGKGADFDTSRPISIETLVVRESSSDYLLDEISQRWWAALTVKDTQSRPEQYYYEDTYPNGTLRFDYVPDKAYTLFMAAYKPHADFASLSEVVSLPPMYEKALRFNLAVDLAPEYGLEPSQAVMQQARDAKLAVMQRNIGNRPSELAVDYGLLDTGRDYDIRGDRFS